MQRLTPTVFKAFLTELMTMMRIQHVSSSNANLLYIYHKYPNNLNYISIIIYFACAFGQLRINLLPIWIDVGSRNRQLIYLSICEQWWEWECGNFSASAQEK